MLNQRGGRTLGVYQTEPRSNFRLVKDLQEQGRIQGMAEADFRPGEAAYLWLMDCLEQIAGEIGGPAAGPGRHPPSARATPDSGAFRGPGRAADSTASI